MQKQAYLAAALAVGFILGSALPSVEASTLGTILKGGAVSTVVSYSADSINSAINKVLAQNKVQSTYATKVVPIISVGDGSRAGAAQVSGPQAQVDQCKAALEIEQTVLGVRMLALIPIDNVSNKNVSRVQGVGVSAQIDIKI